MDNLNIEFKREADANARRNARRNLPKYSGNSRKIVVELVGVIKDLLRRAEDTNNGDAYLRLMPSLKACNNYEHDN